MSLESAETILRQVQTALERYSNSEDMDEQYLMDAMTLIRLYFDMKPKPAPPTWDNLAFYDALCTQCAAKCEYRLGAWFCPTHRDSCQVKFEAK